MGGVSVLQLPRPFLVPRRAKFARTSHTPYLAVVARPLSRSPFGPGMDAGLRILCWGLPLHSFRYLREIHRPCELNPTNSTRYTDQIGPSYDDSNKLYAPLTSIYANNRGLLEVFKLASGLARPS